MFRTTDTRSPLSAGRMLRSSMIAALMAIFAVPIVGAAAAPDAPREGQARQGEQRAAQERGGKERQRKHKPIVIEVVEFLRGQGVTDLSSLSAAREQELSTMFRDLKGQEHLADMLRTLIKALVSEGITTPSAIESMTSEQRRAVMETVRETMAVQGPPGPGPRGDGDRPGVPRDRPDGGPGMRGPRDGGPDGAPGGMLLERLADRLREAGISDISSLTDAQVMSLIPKPEDRGKRENQGERGPQGQRGQGGQRQNPPGDRPQGNRPEAMRPGGPERGHREHVNLVAEVLTFLRSNGVSNIANLTDSELQSLQQGFHEAMHDRMGPGAPRPRQ